MNLMKNTFPAVVAKMEEMVKEISKCVTISTEERLFQIWQEIWRECNRCPNYASKGVPDAMMAKLVSVQDTAFESRPGSKEPEKEKLAALKEKFSQDFFVDDITHEQLRTKVKEWLVSILREVETLPTVVNLEELSRYLVAFKSNTIEVPGQYFSFGEPGIDHHVHIDGFEAEVNVSHGGKLSQRTVKLRGSNGKIYPFHLLAQSSLHPSLWETKADPSSLTENRTSQLLRLVNIMLQKNVQTRKRQLQLFLPPMMGLSPTVQLIQAEADISPLEQVFKDDCYKRGIEPDELYEVYRKCALELPSAPTQQRASAGYNEACRTIVSDTAFTQAINRLFGSATHLFVFKRQFVAQLALTSFVGHVMAVAHRTPSNIYYSPTTANILHISFGPEFNKTEGVLEWKELVPFRLTRNLQTFCNPLWMDGPFASTITAVSRCLAQTQVQEHLRGFLQLYMRDELASWADKPERPTKDIATTNVDLLLQKMAQFSLPVNDKMTWDEVNRKVNQLIETATLPQNLACMDPTWLSPF